MAIKANLTIPIEFARKATVRVVIEMDLEECEAMQLRIESALDSPGNKNWHLQALARELKSLREQTESAILGLEFTESEKKE